MEDQKAKAVPPPFLPRPNPSPQAEGKARRYPRGSVSGTLYATPAPLSDPLQTNRVRLHDQHTLAVSNAVTDIGGAVLLTAITLASFTLTSKALADPDWIETFRPVLDALLKGQPALAASLFLVAAASTAKHWGGQRFPFLLTNTGSALLVLLGSFGGAMAAAITGGAPPGWSLAWQALQIAIGASGSYSLLKQLVVDPVLQPLALKAPKWTQPIFSVVLWFFNKPNPKLKADQLQRATIAGEIAEKETPPQGIRKLTGEPRDAE